MSGSPQVHWTPFYPILIGAADRALHDAELSGRLISVVASLASILLFHLLAHALWPGTRSMAATWLFALLPLRVLWSTSVMTESTFVALALAGALVWMSSAVRPRRGFGGGLLVGAAYLTRPEGVLIFGSLLLGMLVQMRKAPAGMGRSPLRPVLFVVGFLALSLPYMLYLRGQTGHVALTTKVGHILSEVSFSEHKRDPSISELSADGTLASRGAWQDDPRMLARRVLKNSAKALLFLAALASPFALVLVWMALPGIWRNPRRGTIWPVLLAFISPVLATLILLVQARYLYMPVLAALLLAASALKTDHRSCEMGVAGPRAKMVRALLAGAFLWAFLVTTLWAAVGSRRLIVGSDPLLAAVREARGTPGPIVSEWRHKRLAFRTDRDWIRLPWAPLDEVLRYAQLNQASLLVLTPRAHPGVAALMRSGRKPPMLRLLVRAEADAPFRTIRGLWTALLEGPEREIVELYLLVPTEDPEESDGAVRSEGTTHPGRSEATTRARYCPATRMRDTTCGCRAPVRLLRRHFTTRTSFWTPRGTQRPHLRGTSTPDAVILLMGRAWPPSRYGGPSGGRGWL